MLDESIFGVDIPAIEEICIDEEEEAKQYALRLYERIRRIDKDVTEEAISSSSSSGASVSLTLSDDSFEGVQPETIDVREFIEFSVDGKLRVVPVFRGTQKMKEWVTVLNHHEQKLKKILKNLTEIDPQHNIFSELKKIQVDIQQIDMSAIRDKSKRDLAKRTLYVNLAEDVIVQKLGSLAYDLKDMACIIDDTTQGLWVEDNSNMDGHKILEQMSTDRVVLMRRYKFDGHQTSNLINLLFSRKPDVRAQAKLNLSAKLDQSIYHEVVQNPAKTQELVCSEAYLSQMEVLYLVFPKSDRNEDRICPSCGTAVALGRAMYHSRCIVTKWLTEHCRFKYDVVDQCLTPKAMIYLSRKASNTGRNFTRSCPIKTGYSQKNRNRNRHLETNG
jgi:hypothetical protein